MALPDGNQASGSNDAYPRPISRAFCASDAPLARCARPAPSEECHSPDAETCAGLSRAPEPPSRRREARGPLSSACGAGPLRQRSSFLGDTRRGQFFAGARVRQECLAGHLRMQETSPIRNWHSSRGARARPRRVHCRNARSESQPLEFARRGTQAQARACGAAQVRASCQPRRQMRPAALECRAEYGTRGPKAGPWPARGPRGQ
mmetsp:Transcript_2245/g.6078  ORF Transcript_2245/g.6078 Transcript_2245/m.6078 type:complete len:205 (+) Transcript_2245:2174-2788(+)